MAPIVQMAGVVIYHQRAPRYLSAPLQRVFLRKLFWNELLIMGMGIPLGIATFALEYVNEGISPKTLGPNDTEVMTTNFSLRMMSLAGLTCLPGLLQGIVAVRRPTLVPKMGDDILSPVWVHRSLLISLMTAIAGLSLVFAVVALFAQRYAELDMGNDYTPRIPAVVEANLYIAELMRMQPRTPQDVAAAAAVIDESGTPLR